MYWLLIVFVVVTTLTVSEDDQDYKNFYFAHFQRSNKTDSKNNFAKISFLDSNSDLSEQNFKKNSSYSRQKRFVEIAGHPFSVESQSCMDRCVCDILPLFLGASVCSCDSACKTRGDCCDDFEEICKGNNYDGLDCLANRKSSNTTSEPVGHDDDGMHPDYEDETIISDHPDYSPFVPAQCESVPTYNEPLCMVSKCSEFWPALSSVRIFCENVRHDAIFSDVPVTDVDSGITYRNIFCAECNMVLRYELWTKIVECDYLMPKPELGMRELNQYIINDCQVQHLRPPLYLSHILQDCSKCPLDTTPQPDTSYNRKKRGVFKRAIPNEFGGGFQTSFSLLMNMGVDGKTQIFITSTQEVVYPAQQPPKPKCPKGNYRQYTHFFFRFNFYNI